MRSRQPLRITSSSALEKALLRSCVWFFSAGRVEALRRLVRSHVPSAEAAPAAGMECAMRLPLSAARALPDMLEEMDARLCADSSAHVAPS